MDGIDTTALGQATTTMGSVDGATAGTTTEPAKEMPFRTFQTQKEFDDWSAAVRKQGEERAMKKYNNISTANGETIDVAKLTEQIKKDVYALAKKEAIEQYEREQKMSAEEIFAERQKEWESRVREKEIDFNKREAKQLMKEAGFPDARIELELAYITPDREASINRVVELCNLHKQEEEQLKKSIASQFNLGNPNIKIGNSANITAEQAKNMSLTERSKLYQENPELYNHLFKNN